MLYQKTTDNKERAIYYLSKILIDYKTRYTPMEKIYYAIIFTTKKLKHYFRMKNHTNELEAKSTSIPYTINHNTQLKLQT